MKIALIHDGIFCRGGAERVFLNIIRSFPEADIYTSIYDNKNSYPEYKKFKINTSWIQKIAWNERSFKSLFFPFGMRSMLNHNLSKYDVILSSTTHCAKYITANNNTLVINYCYTPFRLAWSPNSYKIYEKSYGVKKIILKSIINKIKKYDYSYAQRANRYITMTNETLNRIKNTYNVKETIKIIKPSIDIKKFVISNQIGNYYLLVSRLEKYKNIELVIESFNKLGHPLIIVGNGTEEKYLKNIANNNIKFLSQIDDNELSKLYSECKALIFPQYEDYGLTAIEANASGRPVIAYGFGGVLSTMIPYNNNDNNNFTSVFFNKQDSNSLINAINTLSTLVINSNFIREHAKKFDDTFFIKELIEYVNREYNSFKNSI